MSEKDIENIDSTNDVSLETLIESEGSTEEKLAKVQEINKKLFARAKKAEEELKEHKTPKEIPQEHLQDNKPSDSLTRDEAILIAQGTDEMSLEMLKKIAKLEGISLLEAKKTDLFQTFSAKIEQEKKSEAARLGASKGSGRIEPHKTSGMTREEHIAWVKEQMG